MNRAERRKSGVKQKVRTYTLTDAQIQQIKTDAVREATSNAFTLLLGLPLITLHDKFGFGKVRLERFMDELLKQYESFDAGYITLNDLIETIKEETGVSIIQKKERKKYEYYKN